MIYFFEVRESFSRSLIYSTEGTDYVGIVVVVTLFLRKMSKMLLDFCLAFASANEIFLFSEAFLVKVAFLSYFTSTLPILSVLRRIVLDTRLSSGSDSRWVTGRERIFWLCASSLAAFRKYGSFIRISEPNLSFGLSLSISCKS